MAMSRDVLLRVVARIGYAARGVIYLLVGAIALPVVVRIREPADIDGALRLIVQQEYGEPVMLAIAAGLASYALWRLMQAFVDADGHGRDVRAWVLRAAFVISAALHLGVAFASFKLALSIDQDQGSSSPARDLAEKLFEWPGGSWLVAAAGIAVAVAGAAHVYKGATGGFRKWLQANPATLRWVGPICRLGLVARGVIFLIVGALVARAAYDLDASDVVGMRGALEWLQSQDHGRWAVAAAGLGLIAFGMYSLVESALRRVGLDNG